MPGWIAPVVGTAGFDQCRRLSWKIFFLGPVPESRLSDRNNHGASVVPSTEGGGATRGELRLRVLRSLPQTHQRYLFEEIEKLCHSYLQNRRVPASEISPKELVSEIWRKLLGTISQDNDETVTPGIPTSWSVNAKAPERDGRVEWLIEQIGGSDALGHRHEDILRQRYGRSLPGRGRPMVQLGNEDEDFGTEPDPGQRGMLEEVDTRRVWHGLLVTADLQFQRDDDVSMLLQLLADVPDILESSTGGQWPVKKIVTLLNDRFPLPIWNGDRVDNAKRRLVNWINRLMRRNGLDATDLEALFARVAREKEGTEVAERDYDPT